MRSVDVYHAMRARRTTVWPQKAIRNGGRRRPSGKLLLAVGRAIVPSDACRTRRDDAESAPRYHTSAARTARVVAGRITPSL